jgi:NAD(P)-dependent dehydrogenase (short-subunit alcohol dehydrogenase family)
MTSFTSQVAVVTGAGRGIGRAIARALATAGAKVAAISRSETELAETVALIEKSSGKARAFPADVSDAVAMAKVFSEIERAFGSVDLLVNNAGIIGPIAPFWEQPFDEWWRVLDVNLRGAALCSHGVLPQMIARRSGRIVNIISGGAATALTHFSAYIVSKTALARFTEILATEAKPFGVSAFALSPATVRTAMAEYSLNSAEGRKWIPWFKRIFDEGLVVPAELPAQFVVKLASGRFDALSGRFLAVSDDLDLLVANLDEIERDNLYSLRVRKLASVKPNPQFDAIRAAGEAAR